MKDRAGMRRRRTGTASRALWGRAAAGDSSTLKLVHVTAVGAAKEIVQAGQIETRKCSHLSNDLAYFFVLRPAYRLRQGGEKSDQISRFPFVFVVSPDRLGDPHHVYPFDTGGALSGVFGDEPDPHVTLEDYELEPSMQAAAQHIEWAFGGVVPYFDGHVRPGLLEALPDFDLEGRSVLRIARLASSGHNQPDRRASAIEIAYSRHVPLADHVEFVVLPLQFLESGGVRNAPFFAALEKLGVRWAAYDWRPNMAPDDFRSEIERILRQRLVE